MKQLQFTSEIEKSTTKKNKEYRLGEYQIIRTVVAVAICVRLQAGISRHAVNGAVFVDLNRYNVA